ILGPLCNTSHLVFHDSSTDGGLEILDDVSPWLRVVISVVYFAVATAGVVGNLLVMFLLYSTHTITTGTINFFVFNLALAHLLFSLALPFWAVDIALDYSWPFGLATCKAVSLLTGLNVFASCFFLTAMSLTRYCYVATALKSRPSLCGKSCTALVATAFIWATALIAATPRALFADLRHVGSGNDTACLFRFPDGTAHISKSVAVVVLSFCVCWFPYNVLTLWSVLIQLDIVDISTSFYSAQTYFFPLANCLAFTSSCFNPVIYCLVRKEYRAALRNVFLKLSMAIISKMPYGINSQDASGQAGQLAIPLNSMYSQTSQTDSRRYAPLSALPTVVSAM
uniref:G-protein coupled receptors family 1 profile domain-containing protein n=1 Tax=Mola mola TaxID=94237 RepID=A0A3Q4BRS7_MOLML